MGHHQQAIAFLEAGQKKEAGRAFFRAARLDLTDHAARAWAGLALCAQLEGREQLAQRANMKLARFTDRAGRRRLIAQLYPHSVTPTPPNDRPAIDGGSPLQALLKQVSDTLQTNADQHPDRADAHYHRAVCNAARGEAAQAADQIKTALTVNPRYDAASAMAMRLGLVHTEEDVFLEDPYGA